MSIASEAMPLTRDERPAPGQKVKPYRSEKYLRFVASLPCANCGRWGRSQAAHSNSGVHGKGMALKSDDKNTFPLCADAPGLRGCHFQFDQGKGLPNFDPAYAIAEARGHGRAAGFPV